MAAITAIVQHKQKCLMFYSADYSKYTNWWH